MKGKIWESVLTDEALASITYIDSYEAGERTKTRTDYTSEERKVLYQRLEDLGYL